MRIWLASYNNLSVLEVKLKEFKLSSQILQFIEKVKRTRGFVGICIHPKTSTTPYQFYPVLYYNKKYRSRYLEFMFNTRTAQMCDTIVLSSNIPKSIVSDFPDVFQMFNLYCHRYNNCNQRFTYVYYKRKLFGIITHTEKSLVVPS